MGFEIVGNTGALSILFLILAIGAGAILVTWLLAAARQDRAALLDEDEDHFQV